MLGLDITATDTVAEFKLGTVFKDIGTNGPEKCYRYVQFNSGAGSVAAVAGNVAGYYLMTGYADNIATSDATDIVGIGAGVFQSAPTTGQYCWLQITGPATLTTALTAGADGNALTVVGAGDGTLDVSALVSDAVCAYASDASAKTIVCCFPM